MNWFSLIAAQIRAEARTPAADPPRPAPSHADTARRLAGRVSKRSRVSQDTDHGISSFHSALSVLAPMADEDEWRLGNFDSRTLDRIDPRRVLELLANLSPDISRALWDFLRMANPGHTITAVRPTGKAAPATAQAALDAITKTIGDRHGDLNVPINRILIATFLRGALCAELVLDRTGRQTLDLATPDPASIRFRSRSDPELGDYWEPFQWQEGQQVPLDQPTFRYIPVDPFPGNPYGRSLASPALFPTLFALVLLHDVRRVVQQQGYPRLDIEVMLDKLRSAMPEAAQEDPVEFKAWVDAVISEVSTFYDTLEPDDAYVHTDAVKVNKPVGAVDASSLAGIDKIMLVLERWAVRALKTMPLLMGTPDGTSEANANRQWEIYAAGIKSIQHLAENLLSYMFTLALEAQGVPARAQVRFAELRAAELLRDAQVEQIQLQNTITKYNQGYISQEEASNLAVGHAPDAEEPRQMSSAAPADTSAMDTQADPGSNRGRRAS